MRKTTTILAIETSCDETGVALVRKQNDEITTLENELASQIDVHSATGGVVPNIAAREHSVALPLLLAKILAKHSQSAIDAIAVTVGPGLLPALAVGVTAARTLAWAWQKPLVPVHHIEGHIYSALLQGEIQFPALALIVSGGHTLLIEVKGHLSYTTIGTTRDDAAGEAFDKIARLLGLPYPGGPSLSKLAKAGDSKAFTFPRPMLRTDTLDFSFSGLKTAVVYAMRELSPQDQELKKADLAASFEAAVVDTLIGKVKKALQQKPYTAMLLAGGVAANQPLRAALTKLCAQLHTPLRVAPLSLCGDNALMIGQVGAIAFEHGRGSSWQDLDATARMPVESFNAAVLQPDLSGRELPGEGSV